ncbi:epimerase, partial [Nitrosococcus oceani]
KAKIKKIIYISGLGVDKFATLGYFISKYKAEQEIIHSGLDYTILRASYMIGNDDPLSENLQRQVKNGEIVIPGSGNYRFQPIFIDDVSRIIIKSVTEKKFSKKIIDLVGPQIVSYNAFVKEFSRG